MSPRLSSNRFTEAQSLVPRIVWCFMGWNLHQLLSLKLLNCRDYVSSGRVFVKNGWHHVQVIIIPEKMLRILLIIQNSGVHHLEGCWIPSPDRSIRPPRARGARAPPLLCHVWVGHHPALLQHRSRIGHEVAIFKPCLELHDPQKKQIVIFKKCISNWKALKKWKIRILKKQDSWSLGIVVVKIDDTWLLFPSGQYILPAITTSMPNTLFLKFPQVPVAPPILGSTFDRHEPQVP